MVKWLSAYRHRAAISAMAMAGTPFLMPFSIGMVALTALRGQAREGLLVTGGAVLALAILQLFMPGAITLALVTAAVYWLPAVALAQILGRTGSLALCLQLLTLLGLAAVLVFWLVVEQPARWWLPVLEQHLAPLLEARREEFDLATLLSGLAQFLTGMVIAAWVLTMALGLMIGRWWQGLLADAATLGVEFRNHRQGYLVGGIAALVFVSAGLTGYVMLQNLVLVLIAIFVLQGLALAHWVVHRRGLSGGWLLAVYVVLPFGAPWSLVVLAAVGFMDNWMNLRRPRTAEH